MDKEILNSAEKLLFYIEKSAFKGYDPYDALLSPIAKIPILKNNTTLRFLTQQLVKRLPLNIRPLLLIKKEINPVTIGLCIQAYSSRYRIYKDSNDLKKIVQLTEQLKSLRSTDFESYCWGYNFDWQARYAQIDAYKPTAVATGIIVHALYEAWKATNLKLFEEMILSAADFVLYNLNRTSHENTFCFSYSPYDHQQVFNASMKAARILSEGYSIHKDEKYLNSAVPAIQFVINHQNSDGSWYYSNKHNGNWIDQYHTGYILDCLKSCISHFKLINFKENYEKGYKFYREKLFNSEGLPKFKSNSFYPVDCTAGGQALLTLSENGDLECAIKTAHYFIYEMQSKQGNFYYRKEKYYFNKTSFMRWSDAWMFAGLWKVLEKTC